MDAKRLRELFDYSDGDLIWKVSRRRVKPGRVAGCLDRNGYLQVRIDGKAYLAHRLVYLMHNGLLPKYIDHIDGDRSNNRIENLRPCELKQNALNAKVCRSSKSGIKNVVWHSRDMKWQVAVSVHGKQKNFGYYDDVELAELVAIEARNKYHGNFARHA